MLHLSFYGVSCGGDVEEPFGGCLFMYYKESATNDERLELSESNILCTKNTKCLKKYENVFDLYLNPSSS